MAKKKKKKRASPVPDGGVVQDSRFNRMHKDPRFKRVKRAKNKVKVGSRFAAMLTDPNFETSTGMPVCLVFVIVACLVADKASLRQPLLISMDVLSTSAPVGTFKATTS